MRYRTGLIFPLSAVVIFSGHARLRAQVVEKPHEDSKAIKADGRGLDWLVPGVQRRDAPEAMAPGRARAGRTEHAGRKNQTACSFCGSTRGGRRLRQAFSRLKA